MSLEISEIHDRLFDDRPAKAGVPYERLAALVAKLLDKSAWVVHSVFAQGDGKEAVHQIDVEVSEPSSGKRRMIIECRDYATKINLDQVRSFATVARQLEPEAAWMITTFGYTSEAEKLARDEGIGLAVLRPAHENDAESRVTQVGFTVEIECRVGEPLVRELALTQEGLDALNQSDLPDGTYKIPGSTLIEDLKGEEQETWSEFFTRVSGPPGRGPGTHVIHAQVDPPRVLVVDGLRLPFTALTFEIELEVMGFRTITEAVEPLVARLVLAAAVGDLEPRVLYEHELRSFAFDGQGKVVGHPTRSSRVKTRTKVEHLPRDVPATWGEGYG